MKLRLALSRAPLLLCLWLVLAALACSRVPSPLTPNFRGSVGLPFQGVLTDAVELPCRGRGYECLRPQGARYGTPGLVSLIQRAAEQVHDEMPGAPLLVGDLSGLRGGRIPNHRSHRNGRDVDFLLFTSDLRGASVPTPGWVKFEADGLGRAQGGHHFVQLDIGRNWALVKALLEAPDADVLWLFVSQPVEALLIEHAIARGEDPLVIWQAENVLLQPRNSLPHDDHFHLRIACPPEAAIGGCEDGGPEWPWLAQKPRIEWPEAVEQITAFLDIESYTSLSPL